MHTCYSLYNAADALRCTRCMALGLSSQCVAIWSDYSSKYLTEQLSTSYSPGALSVAPIYLAYTPPESCRSSLAGRVLRQLPLIDVLPAVWTPAGTRTPHRVQWMEYQTQDVQLLGRKVQTMSNRKREKAILGSDLVGIN